MDLNRSRNNFLKIQQTWDYEKPCEHCGCVYLKSARYRQLCCNHGQFLHVPFPQTQPLPQYLKHLMLERTEHFTTRSSYYNNLFCIVITGVDNGRPGVGFERFNMPASVTLNGKIVLLITLYSNIILYLYTLGRSYHTFPQEGAINGIGHFIYDANQLDVHIDQINGTTTVSNPMNTNIVRNFARGIFNELKEINPFVQDLQMIGNQIREFEQEPTINFIASLNVLTSTFEVGAFLNENRGNQTTYSFKLKDQPSRTVGANSELVEPLVFPLFHPYGESGWSQSISSEVGLLKYMASKILRPEEDLSRLNKLETRVLSLNRYDLASRLMQYAAVEAVSRSIDNQLNYIKNNAGYIMGSGTTEEDEEHQNPQTFSIDEEHEHGNSSNPTFLADSITGSPRHRKKLAANALSLAAKIGKNHVMVTMTTNPLWPEIQEILLPGQSAYDIPHKVVPIFHARKEALIHNLKHGKYFGGKKAESLIHVVEFQHR
jgi:hypothetical protein